MGDYNYYLGGEDGKVYVCSGDYASDNGKSITCSYLTKQLDFADKQPKYSNTFKTVHKVKLLFEDLSTNAGVTISVSTDGGSTWDTKYRLTGSGNSIPCSENFWFITTGESFMFKITHASDDKYFLWNGLEVDFLPRGDYFESA